MIQHRIDMKQKEIKPHKQSIREVEDHLTVLETLQSKLRLVVVSVCQNLWMSLGLSLPAGDLLSHHKSG